MMKKLENLGTNPQFFKRKKESVIKANLYFTMINFSLPLRKILQIDTRAISLKINIRILFRNPNELSGKISKRQ
jgi:hypothetical protein